MKQQLPKDFDEIWSIYTLSFPEDERRDFKQQCNLLNNPLYNFKPLYTKKNLIGFMAFWDIKSFLFIEHFAVDKQFRGKGYGTKFLKTTLENTFKPIILEVEKPEDEMAKKRIMFYEKLGFHLNKYSYKQPSYNTEKKPVPLYLMSYPEKIDKTNFKKVTNTLYSLVYGLDGRQNEIL